MADPRDVEYEEEEGASPAEQLISAINSNSQGTLDVAIDRISAQGNLAEYLNTHALDASGNVLYHLAARKGRVHIINELLDQEGFECDPLNAFGETPLHSVVHWVNISRDNWSTGLALAKMMLDAGSDNRIRNKQGKTAADLVEDHMELKQYLEKFVYVECDENGDPIVKEPAPKKVESEFYFFDEVKHPDDDARSVYSGSDSGGEELEKGS